MKKLTREMIEQLGNEVVELCKKKGYEDTSVYFNGKRVRIGCGDLIIPDDIEKDCYYENVKTETTDDCHPGDCFAYFNHNHILSMSFEGQLYDLLNYYGECKKLEEIFKKYGVYYELGNAWNLSVYPVNDDMEVDGWKYEVKPKPRHIKYYEFCGITELQDIMKWWYEQSKKNGDEGSCVFGAGFNFKLNGIEYFMSACSPYQGSISWERSATEVKEKLRNIGATEIHYDWGRMD